MLTPPASSVAETLSPLALDVGGSVHALRLDPGPRRVGLPERSSTGTSLALWGPKRTADRYRSTITELAQKIRVPSRSRKLSSRSWLTA